MKRILILLPVLSLFSACSAYRNTPQKAPLMARYGTMVDPIRKDGNNAPIALTTLANINAETPDRTEPKTILNFQGEGQKELIAAYAKMSKTPEALKASINSVYFSKSDDNSATDYTNANITLTISVAPKDPDKITQQNLALGDRLEKIKMDFTLNENQDGVYFKTWDQFKTQYGHFYIGSRSFTGSQEVNINPSVTLASGAVFALGNHDSNSQYVEQDTISQQIVVSNGILKDNNFSIMQTGTPKTTLLGNTIINLTIGNTQPKPAYISSFENMTGNNIIPGPEAVKLRLKEIIIPIINRDIKGKLTVTYLYRHIRKGDRTYSEADDEVEYAYGTVTSDNVLLIKQKDLHPIFYELIDPSSQRNLVFQLQDINETGKHPFDLYFSSQEEAANFLTWLKLIINKRSSDILFDKQYRLVVKDVNGIHPVKASFDISSFLPKDVD
ncbi:hypothetical protein [Pedobacter sp. L105]|uniref:hypothetical protein n=1 Tax=Pedobacter sp. L105 TaxID=1641871 RepID=UPI00131CB167|nr:hypothetical protein [Pedobacter sp. L105]